MSTAGTRLLNLQQQLPPIDLKAESCCPSVKNVPIMAAFPPRSVFDTAVNVRHSDGTESQAMGASEAIMKGLGRVKERLQTVRSAHLPAIFQQV